MSEQQPAPSVQPRSFMGTVIIPTLFIFLMLLMAQNIFILDAPLYNFVQTNPSTTVAPWGISFVGQTAFSFTYLLISIIVVFTLVIVIERKKIRDELFWVFALLFLVAAVVEGAAMLFYLPFVVSAAIFIGMWLFYILAAEQKISKYLTLPFMVSFAVFSAVSLVITLPPITLLTLPAIFAVWDVIAVFKIKKPMTRLALALLSMQRFKYLFIAPIGSIHLGLGDIVFYTILSVFATAFGLGIGAQTIGLMTGGFFFSMWLLWRGKYKAIPALPIPIAMGFVGFGLALIGIHT